MQPSLQWKSIITYYECVCVCVCVCSLRYPAAMRMRHIVICDLSGSTTFSALSHTRQDFRQELLTLKYQF